MHWLRSQISAREKEVWLKKLTDKDGRIAQLVPKDRAQPQKRKLPSTSSSATFEYETHGFKSFKWARRHIYIIFINESLGDKSFVWKSRDCQAPRRSSETFITRNLNYIKEGSKRASLANAAYCIGLRLKVGGCKGSSDALHGSVPVVGIVPLYYPQTIRNDRLSGQPLY